MLSTLADIEANQLPLLLLLALALVGVYFLWEKVEHSRRTGRTTGYAYRCKCGKEVPETYLANGRKGITCPHCGKVTDKGSWNSGYHEG